jgi:hypothetical protein
MQTSQVAPPTNVALISRELPPMLMVDGQSHDGLQQEHPGKKIMHSTQRR